MAEIRVIARSVARKGKEKELRDLLRSMLVPTRSESGCKLYELYESSTGAVFYFNEIWESQDALNRHAASPHFKRLDQTIGDLLREPFEVSILTSIQIGAAAS